MPIWNYNGLFKNRFFCNLRVLPVWTQFNFDSKDVLFACYSFVQKLPTSRSICLGDLFIPNCSMLARVGLSNEVTTPFKLTSRQSAIWFRFDARDWSSPKFVPVPINRCRNNIACFRNDWNLVTSIIGSMRTRYATNLNFRSRALTRVCLSPLPSSCRSRDNARAWFINSNQAEGCRSAESAMSTFKRSMPRCWSVRCTRSPIPVQ